MNKRESRRIGRSRAFIRAHWRAHVSSQVSSGLTAAGYCREHGLRPKSFYRWKRVFRESGGIAELLCTDGAEPPVSARSGAKPLFAEVRLPAGPAAAGASGVEVALLSGVLVRISRDFDAETLRRVVSVLEEGGC